MADLPLADVASDAGEDRSSNPSPLPPSLSTSTARALAADPTN